MKSAETRNQEAIIKLLQDIRQAEHMIAYNISAKAGNLLHDIIVPKMYFKDGQTTVELTTEEFTRLRVFLAALKEDKLDGLDKWLEKYQQEIKTKQEIYSMLVKE